MISEIPGLSSVLSRIAEIRARFAPPCSAPPPTFADTLATKRTFRAPTVDPSWEKTIASNAKAHGIEPPLIKALIHAESNFNPRAVSRKGAQGLMQLLPSTALSLGVENPFDPHQNISGGTRYLRRMLDVNNGNLALALASYNAGPNAVKEYGGIPPYPETQRFVGHVLRLSEFYGSTSLTMNRTQPSE